MIQERVICRSGRGACPRSSELDSQLYFVPPETGKVRLHGKIITDHDRDFYRQHFSVVFSDFFLFESLLGLNTEELDARASNYLSRLELERKVQVRGGELSTLDLSQGQRKRLALLTAYLEDRPIYIFDEWAADQDPHFKEIFYYELAMGTAPLHGWIFRLCASKQYVNSSLSHSPKTLRTDDSRPRRLSIIKSLSREAQ